MRTKRAFSTVPREFDINPELSSWGKFTLATILCTWNPNKVAYCLVSSAFCHQDETIKHLFFQCRFTRSIFSIIQAASSLYPLTSFANVFGNWLHGIDLRFRTLIRVGALAIIWLLWLCRNDKVFDNKIFSLL
jgi:hypothetical protein